MDPSSVNMVDARNFEPTEVVVPNANVEPEMPIDPFQEGHAEKQIHTDFYQGFDTKDLSATDLS